MSEILIDAGHLTNQYAIALGKSLRDYSHIKDLCFVVGEGTDMKQELKISEERLNLQLETDELVSMLLLLNTEILTQVKIL